MSLSKYNQKRDFKQTKEPKGKIAKSENELQFVVQKHAASHLHYDFRLELNGVLKSWAIPKGPSMDPEIKRLAMMVEDHPYSYKDFEGSIPEGNYGAGNVIVWDNGTYAPEDVTDTPTKTLNEQLKKGHLSFILKGEKLKGEFSLIKLKGKQENAWLLIKKKDGFSSDIDILKKNKSVISKTTLEAMIKDSAKTSTSKTKKVAEKETAELEKAVFIKPMLAATITEPFEDPEWVFENKYDGYRAIAVLNEDDTKLWSRNKLPFTNNFEAIVKELKKIEHTAVLDGEIVIEDDNGNANFQLLQNYLKTGEGKLKYYVFDLLNLDGNLTTNLILPERKELLRLLLEKYKLSNIIYSEHVKNGLQLYENALKNKSEGIIAKKISSNYVIGKRSNDWLKIKIIQQEEAIIIGITAPKKSRSYFGAVLLAQYYGKSLKFIGKCGTGFTDETLKDLYNTLKPHFTENSPLTENTGLRDTIQWVKPKFVCQVKFSEWTNDKHLRHPVFLGIRTDKKFNEVFMPSTTNKQRNKTVEMEKEDIKENKKGEKNEENDYDVKIGKTTVHLTNQNKIYFPKDGITKGDIVQYYAEVSALILPYLKDRPQSMNRFPNGIDGSSFYQKDVAIDKIPTWLKTKKVYSESNEEYLNYLICNDKQTLLYMANLGCIDINPWNSTIKHIENPDWLVIDIDPAKDNFEEVIRTALTVKEVLDEWETDCYCKTSGATGLHVYIPLGAKYDYDSIKIFSELLAQEIHARIPEITSLERSIKKRNNKIYIDYLQNRRGQTLAAPYSVRPVPGATVSTPLEWNEVTKKLHPSQFTINNVMKRFEKKGDLWQPVLKKGANIKKILQRLENRENH
ncbi:DNA ligase D [Flavobacterium hercynium]|uniref:DNA ligase (ATP) n=1 Tax=Flavobacterium hercynium TaxID=387094 RepID=A0A226GY29_9FLAO|nr:DNA ligase D [Flavobacterium hercynium]OXA86903.1 DNA ligase D [Flavobacterium hercynium]SMP37124.1 ATP-dependent DNA ligase LigD phosphoesterase module /ATP-dependent DNA ligase LigD polymerase module [Flavobacterium hercynium]